MTKKLRKFFAGISTTEKLKSKNDSRPMAETRKTTLVLKITVFVDAICKPRGCQETNKKVKIASINYQIKFDLKTTPNLSAQKPDLKPLFYFRSINNAVRKK